MSPIKSIFFPVLLLALISGALIYAATESEKEHFVKPVDSSLLVIGHIEENKDSLFAPSSIANLSDDAFTEVDGVPTFGFSPSSHWLRLRVFNFEDRPIERILEVTNPILNECILYEVSRGEAKPIFTAGDDFKFNNRPVPHRNYLFPIELEANASQEYLLKVFSAGEQLQVPLKLWEKDEFTLEDGTDRLLRGIYFGIIVFVLIFNLFLYVIIRDRSSLFYVIYIFALLMLQLSLSGFAFEYLWPSSSYFANIANPFFASLSIFALIRFTQTFLNLKKFYPQIHRLFHAAGAVVAVNSLLALIYLPLTFRISVLTINIMALLLNISIIPVVILVLRKNFRPAKYFLIAFLILVGSVFFFILNNFGVLYTDFYAAYGLQIGSAIEVVLLSFAIVDKFKLFREEAYTRLRTINRMKAKANEKLEKEVKVRTREISEQKLLVEQQKDEILDSIRYAERIQQSLLPSDEKVKRLFKDHFIFFKPRDIVSGDFYWVGDASENPSWSRGSGSQLLAAVDCTGHGVPGAMMSMLGHQALEQCRIRPDMDSPAKALKFINNTIVSALNEQSDGDLSVKDGMDMVFCSYDATKRRLIFSGAKNNLYIFREGEVIEIKGNRMSIGSQIIPEDETGFTEVVVELQPNDIIYTFTDGFPDQFGGPRNKKLKAKNLLAFISEISAEEMIIQKERLAAYFDSWKSDQEQIDDVCLLGIRIS